MVKTCSLWTDIFGPFEHDERLQRALKDADLPIDAASHASMVDALIQGKVRKELREQIAAKFDPTAEGVNARWTRIAEAGRITQGKVRLSFKSPKRPGG